MGKRKSKHQVIVEAWENSPREARGRFFKVTGWSRQLTYSILNEGRKDESIIDQFMCAIKQANKDYAADVARANKTVQSL